MAWRYLVLALSVHSVLGAIHKTAPTVAHGWTRRGRPDARQSITLQIGLKQPNLDRLEARLYEISAPDHPDYGQHLPSPDVAALAAPTEESYAAVLAWLRSEGVTRVRRQGAWVTFATSVGRANRVLRADFAHYARDGVTRLRTLRYSLPDHLAAHVDLVHPTTYFGATAAHAPRNHIWKQPEAVAAPAAANASCGELLTPPCVRDLYNVGDYMPDPQSGSRVGFGNFLNQTPSFADLAQFERQYNIPSQNLSVALINGGVNNQSAARGERVEADLDAQYVVALAHPLPVSAFITGGSPPFIPNLDEPVLDTNEPYLEYYDYLLAQPNSALPQVISNSYGDDEQTVPLDYARRVCDQIMQLTARGVSVLESSGDTGVGAACRATDGSNAPRFTPQFPAGCPFVTAVGGTQQYRPEAAWLGSGGGFSDYFARPKYQDAAVQAYLAEGISDEAKEYYKPFVNFSGRGFPDLAAHSEDPNYAVIVAGQLARIAGTSAAAPVVAGLVALLNDARLRAGFPTLGFLNPWLYAGGHRAFLDITTGKSVGCNGFNSQTGEQLFGGGVILAATWNATKGWDPVTGWGVPDFEKWRTEVTGGYGGPGRGVPGRL